MSADENEVAEQTASPAKPKTVVETVDMEDGRKVEFAGKRKINKVYHLDDAGNLVDVQFDFRNGMTRKYTPPAALLGQFAGHGMLQKYGDELAGFTGPDGGEPDIEDMVMQVDELDERIQKGEWGVRREGGGTAGTSVLIKALMEFSGKALDDVKAFLKDKSPKDKIALRGANKKRNAAGLTIKDIVTRLESEKASKAANVDTDAMLEAL